MSLKMGKYRKTFVRYEYYDVPNTKFVVYLYIEMVIMCY